MFERDYLLGQVFRLIEAIRRHRERQQGQCDSRETAEMLQQAIGEATDIDGAVLLSLAPESMVAVLQVSGTDEHVIPYVAHSLKLVAECLESEPELAALRMAQAQALADAYSVDLSLDPLAENDAIEEDF